MKLSGLKDKLYWRETHDGWHCFEQRRASVLSFRGKRRATFRTAYVSLCGRHERERSDGQQCRRPEAWRRCRECDVREMKRRGWEESGPVS